MNNEQREAVQAAHKLVSQGVTAIKIELEGDDDIDTSNSYCDNCGNNSEDGWHTCSECDGDWDDVEQDCPNCEGRGTIEIASEYNRETESYVTLPEPRTEDCSECDGSGTVTDYCPYCEEGEVECDDHVVESHYSGALRAMLESVDVSDTGRDGAIYRRPNTTEWLVYAQAYHDGSVSLEVTATIDIQANPENILHLQDLVSAFYALDPHMDTSNAGMHMSVLFDSQKRYPSSDVYLDARKLRNLDRALKFLYPALYICAAKGTTTRSTYFRQPRTNQPKYNAVNIMQEAGAIEFRVFDTCYDNPVQVLENVVVMSNIMDYYSNRAPRFKSTKKSYTLGRDEHSNELTEFLDDDALDLAEKYLKYVKPKTMRVGTKLGLTKRQREQKQAERKATLLELARTEAKMNAERDAKRNFLDRVITIYDSQDIGAIQRLLDEVHAYQNRREAEHYEANEKRALERLVERKKYEVQL